MGNYSSSQNQTDPSKGNYGGSSQNNNNNSNNKYSSNAVSPSGGKGQNNGSTSSSRPGTNNQQNANQNSKFSPGFSPNSPNSPGPMDQSSLYSMPPASTAANNTDETISAVFKWDGGGKSVYITGTFNNWKMTEMHRSGNDFSYIQNVTKGAHHYRFIVDNQPSINKDVKHYEDPNRLPTNWIDFSDFSPYTGDENFFDKSKEQKLPDSEFHNNVPDVDDYTKEPPNLPPHLRHIILNKSSPNAEQMTLPTPQHVSLNHLYCTAIKDNMMVLGSTHRYKEKYCTVVFYALMPPSTQ